MRDRRPNNQSWRVQDNGRVVRMSKVSPTSPIERKSYSMPADIIVPISVPGGSIMEKGERQNQLLGNSPTSFGPEVGVQHPLVTNQPQTCWWVIQEAGFVEAVESVLKILGRSYGRSMLLNNVTSLRGRNS